MFNNKDYREYFDELYRVELKMKRDAKELSALVLHPEAQKILAKIVADEIRHAKLVKSMQKLI